MRNPIPAPIVVPTTGAPTCCGIALTVRSLADWFYENDLSSDADALVRLTADRAIRDGHVLCLRPTADRPACVGLSPTQFAVSSLQDDFAARALVVDPYDAEGNDIREGVQVADMSPSLTEQETHDVAVWDGSERV